MNLEEEYGKMPLIVEAVKTSAGEDKNEPFKSQNFKIFETLLISMPIWKCLNI